METRNWNSGENPNHRTSSKESGEFVSGVVSMDVEDVKASYYDIMRMLEKIVISKDSQPFQWHQQVGEWIARRCMEADSRKGYVGQRSDLVC